MNDTQYEEYRTEIKDAPMWQVVSEYTDVIRKSTAIEPWHHFDIDPAEDTQENLSDKEEILYNELIDRG